MDAARRDTSISGLRLYRLRFVLGALRSIIVPKPVRSTHAAGTVTARVLRTAPALNHRGSQTGNLQWQGLLRHWVTGAGEGRQVPSFAR